MVFKMESCSSSCFGLAGRHCRLDAVSSTSRANVVDLHLSNTYYSRREEEGIVDKCDLAITFES